MNRYNIILKNASIIDEVGDIHNDKNIYIKDGKISKISETFEDKEGIEIIDCKGYFVTPGLVNLHTHVPMGLLRGLAEDVNIEDWFNKEIFPYESKFTSEKVYYGALLGIYEMLDNGVTAFADHYFFSEEICKAVIETGIRGDIAPTVFGLGDNFEANLEEAASIIKEGKDKSNRLKLRMGPHAPYTCPPDKLKKIVNKAEELEVGLHIHVSETEEQVEESLKTYNKTPFQLLNDCGAFNNSIVIGHGLWIREDDIKYLNNKTYFAVCPKTYMKLGMGQGNLWNMYDRLPLCIGTDGSASSNTLNPLEQIRLFSLLGKLNNEAERFTLKEMWKILMKGHEALEFNSGILKEGYSADLLIWDLNMSNTYPAYNPLASIIYSAESKNIIYSIIDGKFVKKNGNVLFINDNIWKEINRCSKDVLETGKGKNKIKY